MSWLVFAFSGLSFLVGCILYINSLNAGQRSPCLFSLAKADSTYKDPIQAINKTHDDARTGATPGQLTAGRCYRDNKQRKMSATFLGTEHQQRGFVIDYLKRPSLFKEIPVSRVDIDDDRAIARGGPRSQLVRYRPDDGGIEGVVKIADEIAGWRIEFGSVTA